MVGRFALVVVVVAALIAVPGIGNAASPNDAAARSDVALRNDRGDVVRQLAVRVGHVLGAAFACQEISRPRIKAITDKMTDVIKASASNANDLAAAQQSFDNSVAEGLRGAMAGQGDCATTGRDFAELERVTTASPPGPAAPPAPAAAIMSPPPAPPAVAAAPRQATATNVAPLLSPSVSGPGPQGVTDKEIRLGMSAPLSGPAKELGRQMKLGIETAFNVANEAGGVNGRQLRLIAADDGYEPGRTAEVMRQLYEQEQVFCIVGNVGTPTAAVALPYALEHRMLFYGAFTGAPLLRRDPPDRYVFNYRASYAEETDSVVRYLVKVRGLRPDQIAVFAQEDAYGDAGFAGVTKAMRVLRGGNGGAILRFNYKRNTVDVDDAIARLRALKTNPIKAIVMVATYRAAAKFIEKTRDFYPDMIYTNVSFVGSTALAEELMLLGPRYATGVIVTQVVPAVDSYATAILEYKSALAKYAPGETPDYVSLEGYVSAKVLVEAIRRAGRELDTEKLVSALEGLRDFDIGLGASINFGMTEHQGVHKVWGTEIDKNGHYQAIDLQ
jgi:ABC-type branched-subunit amino acid transport system substrate-binding protein